MTSKPTFRDFLRQVHEDWVAGDRSVSRPGTHAVAVYRFGRWAQTLSPPAGTLLLVVYRVLYNVVRLVHRIELPIDAEIGRRLKIAHFGTTIIGSYSRIGDDCLIRHNVTLGSRDKGRRQEAPTLEDRVELGPGVVIMGAVTVGAGAKIGPNAVVFSDVPPNARVVAVPAEVRMPRGPGAPAEPSAGAAESGDVG